MSIPVQLAQIDELPLVQVYLVAGPAASGKTTFATELAMHLKATVLSMDHYFVEWMFVAFFINPRIVSCNFTYDLFILSYRYSSSIGDFTYVICKECYRQSSFFLLWLW